MTPSPSLLLARSPEDWSEDQFDRYLFRGPKSLSAMTGWVSYHVLRSKGSKAGYPDRTCFRERILFVETKSQHGRPTEAQVEWLDAIAKAGGECYLWRPSDLDEIGRILGERWRFGGLARTLVPLRGADSWVPGSLWISGEGRADGCR